MQETTDRGFRPVLANRNFRALWLAQLLAQTSQHAIHFIQMVLIEKLTGSTMHLGLTILAFSLPGVLFSPIAGVVVDRWPKKWILVGSNLIRVCLCAQLHLLIVRNLQRRLGAAGHLCRDLPDRHPGPILQPGRSRHHPTVGGGKSAPAR